MSWLSKKINKAKEDGISVSKTWNGDHVNRIARAVVRIFTGRKLFICLSCRGEWNQEGKVRDTPMGYVKQDEHSQSLSSAIICPYCDRGCVRPKGRNYGR